MALPNGSLLTASLSSSLPRTLVTARWNGTEETVTSHAVVSGGASSSFLLFFSPSSELWTEKGGKLLRWTGKRWKPAGLSPSLLSVELQCGRHGLGLLSSFTSPGLQLLRLRESRGVLGGMRARVEKVPFDAPPAAVAAWSDHEVVVVVGSRLGAYDGETGAVQWFDVPVPPGVTALGVDSGRRLWAAGEALWAWQPDAPAFERVQGLPVDVAGPAFLSLARLAGPSGMLLYHSGRGLLALHEDAPA